jgi:hypothetical protein
MALGLPFRLIIIQREKKYKLEEFQSINFATLGYNVYAPEFMI